MWGVAISEVFGSRPSGLKDHQPGVVFLVNNNLRNVLFSEDSLRILRRGLVGILALQTPTTVDNRWVYWVCSLLSTKEYIDKENRSLTVLVTWQLHPYRLPLRINSGFWYLFVLAVVCSLISKFSHCRLFK